MKVQHDLYILCLEDQFLGKQHRRVLGLQGLNLARLEAGRPMRAFILFVLVHTGRVACRAN